MPGIAGAGLVLGPHCSSWRSALAPAELPEAPGGGLWDQAAASTPPPQPGSRAAQGQPKAHQQVHGDVAGLQVRWEAILQVRVRNESQLGNQGWAQPHDGEAGPWRWDRPEVKVGCQCTGKDPQAPWTGRGSSAAEDPGLSQN